jgi:hypothetical protein
MDHLIEEEKEIILIQFRCGEKATPFEDESRCRHLLIMFEVQSKLNYFSYGVFSLFSFTS